jgi:hypothetical protein
MRNQKPAIRSQKQVKSSIGLSYRPASLSSLAGRGFGESVRQPYARVEFIPPVREFDYRDGIFKLIHIRCPGKDSKESIPSAYVACAGIFKQSMGARNQVGIGLLYRPAMLYRLAESIPGLLKSLKIPSLAGRYHKPYDFIPQSGTLNLATALVVHYFLAN